MSNDVRSEDGAKLRINSTWGIGLLLNGFLTALVFDAMGPVVGGVMLALFAAGCIGTLLAIFGGGKFAAALVIISAIGFVPLGMIMLHGFRKAQESVREYLFFHQKESC